MSLILDALNKADREQDPAPVPNLQTHHAQSAHHRVDMRWYYALSALTLVLLVASVVLAIAYFRQATDDGPREVREVNVPRTAVKPVEATDTRLESPGELQVVSESLADNRTAMYGRDQQADESIAALYQPDVSHEVQTIHEPEVRTQEPESVNSPPAHAVDAALAKALWDESNIRYRPPPQPKVEAPPPRQDGPPPAEGETIAGFAEVPFLHDLSVAVQNTIPTLMYSGHFYDKGYAVINKKEVQEGDTLAEQLSVHKVLADGLIFQLGDQQFKLSALNSWVNF